MIWYYCEPQPNTITISVPPEAVAIRTEPSFPFENEPATVICNVGEVKPFKDLTMQLYNGTELLGILMTRQYLNNTVIGTIQVNFTRYILNYKYDSIHFQSLKFLAIHIYL